MCVVRIFVMNFLDSDDGVYKFICVEFYDIFGDIILILVLI